MSIAAYENLLYEGLRIEAECFNRLFSGAEINERDHPDRARHGGALSPGRRRADKG